MNKISRVVIYSSVGHPVNTFVISRILYKERNFQQGKWNYHRLYSFLFRRIFFFEWNKQINKIMESYNPNLKSRVRITIWKKKQINHIDRNMCLSRWGYNIKRTKLNGLIQVADRFKILCDCNSLLPSHSDNVAKPSHRQ